MYNSTKKMKMKRDTEIWDDGGGFLGFWAGPMESDFNSF